MARKDNRGRNLKVGESQRKDGLYMYHYTDERTGKRVAIYDADLAALREKERQIAREMDDGIVTDRAAKDALGDNGEPAKEKMELTPSQQNRLLSFVERSSVYNVYLPMLQIMIGTGCRCGELIGLTWADVDMEKKEVSISCQLIYKNYGDGYKFHVSTPKTDAGIRKIPMSDTVYKAFAAQKRQNFLQRIPRNVEIEGCTDFIFMSKNGRPLMPSAVNNVLYNIVAAYNKQETEQDKKEKRKAEYMPSISAHTLRHTGCTRMAEQGLDMKVVQYIMGHANIGVTMEVYNHITDGQGLKMRLPKWTLFKWYKGVRKWCKCGVVDQKNKGITKRKTGVKPVKSRKIGTSQFFYKIISTHLLLSQCGFCLTS